MVGSCAGEALKYGIDCNDESQVAFRGNSRRVLVLKGLIAKDHGVAVDTSLSLAKHERRSMKGDSYRMLSCVHVHRRLGFIPGLKHTRADASFDFTTFLHSDLELANNTTTNTS